MGSRREQGAAGRACAASGSTGGHQNDSPLVSPEAFGRSGNWCMGTFLRASRWSGRGWRYLSRSGDELTP